MRRRAPIRRDGLRHHHHSTINDHIIYHDDDDHHNDDPADNNNFYGPAHYNDDCPDVDHSPIVM